MALDTDRIRVIMLDSYSTLLDVDSAADALRGIFADQADSIASLWRSESLVFSWMCNIYGIYEDFYELNRRALQFSLQAHGVQLDDEQREEALSVYHHLAVFPDVTTGIARLHAAGYPVYVLSNGDPAMLRSLVKSAGLQNVLQDFISADEIKQYKPSLDLYRHAAKRAGVAVEEAVMISAVWFDVKGAQLAGMQGIWMNRSDAPARPIGPKPNLQVRDFNDVAQVFSC